MDIAAFQWCASARCCEWLPRERQIVVTFVDCLTSVGAACYWKKSTVDKKGAAFPAVVGSVNSGMLSGLPSCIATYTAFRG